MHRATRATSVVSVGGGISTTRRSPVGAVMNWVGRCASELRPVVGRAAKVGRAGGEGREVEGARGTPTFEAPVITVHHAE
jgi:hypothetical protein